MWVCKKAFANNLFEVYLQHHIHYVYAHYVAGSLLLGPYDPITNMERKWLHTYLPASSEQINFIDVLGQNTKTKVIPSTDFKSLKFQLRYPLLGGWKSKYTLQYFVPVHEYLKTNNKGEFELKMRVIDHVLNDAVIKSARTRVILPEGSQVRKITVSNMFYKCEQGLSVTSLSYSGRPTVWVFGKMLTENQILPFTISYHVSSMYFYRIPLIFTAFIQALFCIIIWLRYFKYWSLGTYINICHINKCIKLEKYSLKLSKWYRYNLKRTRMNLKVLLE